MSKLEKCPECGGQVAEGCTISLPEEVVAGVRFRVKVAGKKCRDCDDELVSADVMARKELLIASRLLRGERNAEVLKYARKALGMRAVDLAEMLELDAATISRWETGRSPIDRAAWLLLWSLTELRVRTGLRMPPPREQPAADQSIDLST
jgi:DNA-binding transcriptional regulator YiaG